MIYFDNAATSRVKPEAVYEALNYYIREIGASPGRGCYQLGITASRMLFQSRKCIADFFGIKHTSNVIFTKNSTEAINLYFYGILEPQDHVIISPFEHNAVLRPLHDLYLKRHISYSVITEQDLYNEDISVLEKYIEPNTKVVALTLASNLTGQFVFSVERAKFFHDRGITVFVDASQGAGKHLINIERDYIDVLAFTGHKDLLGIPGVGGLCTKKMLIIQPLIQGGTGVYGDSYVNPEVYPEAYEAGTLNMPAIWALKAGIEFVNNNHEMIKTKEKHLLDILLTGLNENDNICLYNEKFSRVSTVCFNLKNAKSNEVVEFLDNKQICVRGGIHCAILAHETLGTLESGVVRISLNFNNSIEEVEILLEVLREMG